MRRLAFHLTGRAQPRLVAAGPGRLGLFRAFSEGEGGSAAERMAQTEKAVAAAVSSEVAAAVVALKNLPFAASSDTVGAFLKAQGLPKPATIDIRHTSNGKPKGLAFLEFKDPAQADVAVMSLAGLDFEGRPIKAVRRATPVSEDGAAGNPNAAPKKTQLAKAPTPPPRPPPSEEDLEEDELRVLRRELYMDHDATAADAKLRRLLKEEYRFGDDEEKEDSDMAGLREAAASQSDDAPSEGEKGSFLRGTRRNAQQLTLAAAKEKRDSRPTMDEDDGKLPGKWAETIVSVDRVQKVTTGGVEMTYRTLVVIGNANGAGGFGMGRAQSPPDSVARALRAARKNIVVLDRFKNASLVHSVEGRHNNCKVILRAVPPGYGMKGGRIARAVLTQMGISDFTAKAHGRRKPFSVVRAIFKALARHQSLSEISKARGRRIIELEWRKGA